MFKISLRVLLAALIVAVPISVLLFMQFSPIYYVRIGYKEEHLPGCVGTITALMEPRLNFENLVINMLPWFYALAVILGIRGKNDV